MTAKHAKIEFDELDITGQLDKAAATLASQASTQAKLDRVLWSGNGDTGGDTAGRPEGVTARPAQCRCFGRLSNAAQAAQEREHLRMRGNGRSAWEWLPLRSSRSALRARRAVTPRSKRRTAAMRALWISRQDH